MLPTRETYAVEIAGLRRQLPLFEVAPGLRIAVLNILGDTELGQACDRQLADRLQGKSFYLIVTAESKSIPLAHAQLNLTKIESRPYPGRPWEYVFFIDFEGHRDEAASTDALKELAAYAGSMKVFGSYPRA